MKGELSMFLVGLPKIQSIEKAKLKDRALPFKRDVFDSCYLRKPSPFPLQKKGAGYNHMKEFYSHSFF